MIGEAWARCILGNCEFASDDLLHSALFCDLSERHAFVTPQHLPCASPILRQYMSRSATATFPWLSKDGPINFHGCTFQEGGGYMRFQGSLGEDKSQALLSEAAALA